MAVGALAMWLLRARGPYLATTSDGPAQRRPRKKKRRKSRVAGLRGRGADGGGLACHGVLAGGGTMATWRHGGRSGEAGIALHRLDASWQRRPILAPFEAKRACRRQLRLVDEGDA
jgi:hypothetical protein